jgi:prephenate dehydrogenase
MTKIDDPSVAPALFKNALIFGLGVIGGSMALGLKKRGVATLVSGYSLPHDAQAALEANAIDRIIRLDAELSSAIEQADLIVLALPVDVCVSLLPIISEHLGPSTVVTDVCSVKKTIAEAITRQLGSKAHQFVPAHPIAGSHLSGFAGAQETLFDDATVIIAPCDNAQAFKKVGLLWRALGAQAQTMSNELHDEHYANVSHLPHLVAFSLVNAVINLSQKQGCGALEKLPTQVGKGFLDTTRIAASSAHLWAGIALANQEALLKSLDEFIEQVSDCRNALAQNDAQGLEDSFRRASEFRKLFD